jgi:tRNA pseudouridine55 synthase
VDKPFGFTSHDVVAKMRGLAGTRAVGHGGTLDPMATGVLICGIGKGTKLLTYISGSDKSYDATIRLGVSTTTDDAEGEVVSTNGAIWDYRDADSPDPVNCVTDLGSRLDETVDPDGSRLGASLEKMPLNGIFSERARAALERESNVSKPGSGLNVTVDSNAEAPSRLCEEHGDEAIQKNTSSTRTPTVTAPALQQGIDALTGSIMQVPTSVSAIKVDGQRAYKLVREGEQVELAARPVTVSEFKVWGTNQTLAHGVPVLDVKVSVTVSSGTYVRALARDLGAALGTGGHLTELRRTRIGKVDLDMAQTFDQLTESADAANAGGAGLPTTPLGEAASLFLPVVSVSQDDARELSHGRFIDAAGVGSVAAALNPTGDLVAIVEPFKKAQLKPKIVFASAGA